MNLHHALETYRGHTVPRFRLIEKRNRWFTVSGVVILLSLGGLLFRGLNLSIDFEGGAKLEYPFKTSVTVQQVEGVLSANGHPNSQVQIVNGNTISIRTSTLTAKTGQSEILLKALADQAGITTSDINQTDIGPTWGGEISKKAVRGLIVVLLGIGLYIGLRFEPKMAAGAMIALVHDVVITAGIYALVGREVTPATVIAILTILGFSLYDTVVIYDKIQENTTGSGMVAKLGYAETVNDSLNHVLMRSVNTSLVVLLPILSLLLFGGDTLKDFAFAMFIGVTTGAYSSIFIAAPILVILKGREKRFQQLEQRRAARPVRVGMGAAAGEAAASEAAATRSTARTSSGTARPRSKGKRKPPAKRKRR
ncbi:MAG: protein translocase subunit SecF [Actinobacteria bacterium]|nr:protein translocase subunit SecF [Actinomycetota bacterium]